MQAETIACQAEVTSAKEMQQQRYFWQQLKWESVMGREGGLQRPGLVLIIEALGLEARAIGVSKGYTSQAGEGQNGLKPTVSEKEAIIRKGELAKV